MNVTGDKLFEYIGRLYVENKALLEQLALMQESMRQPPDAAPEPAPEE